MSSTNTRKLSEDDRARLVELATADGLIAAARRLGINRQTYAVLAAGIPANPTTVLGVQARLSDLTTTQS